jgi:cell wall assembly regulator SMI1
VTRADLERTVANTDWEGNDGLSAEELDAIERQLSRPLPAEMRAFYQWSEGGDAASVHFFDRDELVGANESLSPNLPHGGWFLASDGGDGWFFFDREGSLGIGPGAVLWMERGWPVPDDMVPVASDVPSFLLAALEATDANPSWDRLGSIRDRRIRAMREALAAHPSVTAATAAKGATEEDIAGAEERFDCHIPRELATLLETSDGPLIGSLQFLRASNLGPVIIVGGTPFLMKCADGRGAHYAVTFRSEREPNGGRLFKMADGAPPEQGDVIGPLPDVVIALLQGKEEVLKP